MSMIINKENKGYEEQSHRVYPENWNGEDWLPVPPDLEAKVRGNAPYCELVIEDGVLVDITPTERPEEPDDPTPPGGDLEGRVAALEAAQASAWSEQAAAIREGVNSVE